MQEIWLEGISMWVREEWAAAMWSALAALPSLRIVEMNISNDSKWHPDFVGCDDLRYFLHHITKLTQIR